jgi:hypothetical protein
MTAVGLRPRIAARVGSGEEAVRRVAIVLLLALGLGAIVVAVWSLRHGGIGWDTRFDTESSLVVRSIDSSAPLPDAYAAVEQRSEFYGVLPQQLADALHAAVTGSTKRLQPDDPATYQYQAAGTLLLALAAVSAFAAALGAALRSLLAGAFVWSLTLATPLWLGMEHVDFKDMPLAAGLTLVTAGFVFASVVRSPRRATLAGASLAGAGGAIALATRPGSVVLLGALVGGTAAATLVWAAARRSAGAALPVSVTALSAAVCAFAFTWATNPFARIDMAQWLRDSLDVARKYPWDVGPIRTAGKDLRSIDLPWWYAPAWLGAQLPLLTIAALVGAIAALVVLLVRRRRRMSARTAIPLVPVALQGVVIPVGVVASDPVLYDGIRHLLFMLPALLAIPAVALAVLARSASRSHRRLAVALPVAAVVVVAASLAASARWAPYAYAFVNPVAGRNADGRSWELDYWGVSSREGVTRLRKMGFPTVYSAPTAKNGMPWGAVDQEFERGNGVAIYVFIRWQTAADYKCDVLFTIERDGHVLGQGARCPRLSADEEKA